MRQTAAEGLAIIGQTQTAMETFFALALNSEDLQVRRVAAEWLDSIGEPATGILLNLARDSSDISVRSTVTRGLLDNSSKFTVLTVLLADPSRYGTSGYSLLACLLRD